MDLPTGVWKEIDDVVKSENVPIHIMIEVSRRCNINCVHCYNIKDREHLSYEELDDIFGQLREAGCLFITLTGGEFFARTDAVDILYLARDHGFDIRMITNGTLITEEKAKILADVGLSEVGISLLGATAETHDRLTRMPGAYDRCVQGIKNCIKYEVPVNIKTTLMRGNLHEFPDIQKFAKELGIMALIDPVVTPRDDGDTANLSNRLTDEQLEKYYFDHFEQMKAEQAENPSYERKRGLPCEAGTNFGSISADGSVYPCVQLPRKVGNIKTERFKDIWQNAEILKLLRSVESDQFGHCNSCQGGCSHCPGLAYLETGDMFGNTSMGCFIEKTYKKYVAKKEGREYVHEPCGSHCTCQ